MASGFPWRFSFLKLPQNHGPSSWFWWSQHPASDSCWVICDANTPPPPLTTVLQMIWSWIKTCVGFPYKNPSTNSWWMHGTQFFSSDMSGPSQISWKSVNCVSNSTHRRNFPSHRSDLRQNTTFEPHCLQPGMTEIADLDFWVATPLSYGYFPCVIMIWIL